LPFLFCTLTALADEGRYQVVTNQGISQAFIEKQKDPAKAWRDDMNKIRDDPLLAIKQAEKRQREKIMDNPLKIMQFKEVFLSRRDTLPSVDTLPSGSATLGARQRRGFSHELPRATGSRPNYHTVSQFLFPSCGSRNSHKTQTWSTEPILFLMGLELSQVGVCLGE